MAGRIVNAKEAKQDVSGGVVGNEGPAALPAHEEAVLDETVEPAAHCALADAEFAGESEFAWQQRAGFPHASFNPGEHIGADLHV